MRKRKLWKSWEMVPYLKMVQAAAQRNEPVRLINRLGIPPAGLALSWSSQTANEILMNFCDRVAFNRDEHRAVWLRCEPILKRYTMEIEASNGFVLFVIDKSGFKDHMDNFYIGDK